MFFKKNQIPAVDVVQLKEMMDKGEEFTLLDVREPDEYEFCKLPGSILIPLGQIENRADELDSSKKTVVMCRSGGRSGQAVEILMEKGFQDICNLTGGILAWSDKIDPSVPKY